MNRSLTEIYCHLLCRRLKEINPKARGRGALEYEAEIIAVKDKGEMRSVLKIAGAGPRDLSFRMADIIKYRRSKIWPVPAFIIPNKAEGIYVKDSIYISDGVDVGALANATAEGLSIFVEKYMNTG